MPISFGHPAAADALLSFVVRFNADSPLMIRELEEVPRMDHILYDYLIRPKPFGHFVTTRQGQKKLLWENSNFRVIQIDCLGNSGGTVFVYICASSNDDVSRSDECISLGVEATCRGMSCRVSSGLLDHKTLAKGKKFEASWRKFNTDFIGLSKSQLLMVLYQSGQDTEMGSIVFRPVYTLGKGSSSGSKSSIESLNPNNNQKLASTTLDQYWERKESKVTTTDDSQETYEYEHNGVFNPICIDGDDDSFRNCGVNHHQTTYDNSLMSSASRIFGDDYDGIDDAELQTALAVSRQDYHGGGVVDVPSGEEDALLKEALERSCEDQQHAVVRIRSREDAFGVEKENKNKSSKLITTETIDLTATATAAAATSTTTTCRATLATNKSNSNNITNNHPTVLDLTDSNNKIEGSMIHNSSSTGKDNNSNFVMRSNTSNERENGNGHEEILILDSDDDDDKPNETENTTPIDRNDHSTNIKRGDDKETKRKLAAKAALHRLERGR